MRTRIGHSYARTDASYTINKKSNFGRTSPVMTKSNFLLFADVCPLRTIETDFSAIAALKELLFGACCLEPAVYDRGYLTTLPLCR